MGAPQIRSESRAILCGSGLGVSGWCIGRCRVSDGLVCDSLGRSGRARGVSWDRRGILGFSMGCRVFLLFLWFSLDFFLFGVLGAQGFWAMGLTLDWVSMVEIEM